MACISHASRKPRNHRRGIFRAEAQNIHHRRVKTILQNLLRTIGVSRACISFFDATIEPSTVICRNIRPAAGIQNHDFASTIQITRPSFRSFGTECLSPSRNSLKEAVQRRNSQLDLVASADLHDAILSFGEEPTLWLRVTVVVPPLVRRHLHNRMNER